MCRAAAAVHLLLGDREPGRDVDHRLHSRVPVYGARVPARVQHALGARDGRGDRGGLHEQGQLVGVALGVFGAGGAGGARIQSPALDRAALARDAGAIGIVPSALFVLRNALTSNPTTGGAVQAGGQLSPGTLLKELSYTCQLSRRARRG